MPRRKNLTFQQAEEIRALYRTGRYTYEQIADQYSVLKETVGGIVRNKILTHGGPRKPKSPTLEKGPTYRGLAVDTLVLTDSGWKKAFEVQLTDKLVAIDGTYTDIVSIHTDEESPLFKVSFLDNVSVVTAADHRWMTLDQKVGYREGWMLRCTERLSKLVNGFHVPTCQAIPGKKWKGADPYVIGMLLGDGCTVPNIECTTLYNEDDFILNYMVNVHGWKKYHYPPQVPRVQCTSRPESEKWKDVVGRSKAHTKCVPKELLEADPETRLAVLQGLMDTDGTADPIGRVSFNSVSIQLAGDGKYLVNSLGGKASIHYVDRGPTGRGGGPIYDIHITPCNKFIPFRLPRKIERCKEMNGVNRCIDTISEWGHGATVSFVIAHESHQFVVQNCLVVHDATGLPSCRKLPVKK